MRHWMSTSNILRRFLGVTQVLNLAYATTIATASPTALQSAISHHGIVPNNLDAIPTSINFFPQQFIVATANNPPTINALAFVDRVGEFFWAIELEFPIKGFEKKFVACHLILVEG